jgi:hypothetical protein
MLYEYHIYSVGYYPSAVLHNRGRSWNILPVIRGHNCIRKMFCAMLQSTLCNWSFDVVVFWVPVTPFILVYWLQRFGEIFCFHRHSLSHFISKGGGTCCTQLEHSLCLTFWSEFPLRSLALGGVQNFVLQHLDVKLHDLMRMTKRINWFRYIQTTVTLKSVPTRAWVLRPESSSILDTWWQKLRTRLLVTVDASH